MPSFVSFRLLSLPSSAYAKLVSALIMKEDGGGWRRLWRSFRGCVRVSMRGRELGDVEPAYLSIENWQKYKKRGERVRNHDPTDDKQGRNSKYGVDST